jgi:hypothetical protein
MEQGSFKLRHEAKRQANSSSVLEPTVEPLSRISREVQPPHSAKYEHKSQTAGKLFIPASPRSSLIVIWQISFAKLFVTTTYVCGLMSQYFLGYCLSYFLYEVRICTIINECASVLLPPVGRQEKIQVTTYVRFHKSFRCNIDVTCIDSIFRHAVPLYDVTVYNINEPKPFLVNEYVSMTTKLLL